MESPQGRATDGGTGQARADVSVGGLVEQRVQEWLGEQLGRAAGHLGCRGDIRVKVVCDAEMAYLHERYGGVEGTTDVLTFDLRPEETGPLDVDVVVCRDEAQRKAAELGHELERELLLYAVHGVLHCMGHDDHDEAAARRMHAREDEVLSAIGVGVTYGKLPGSESRATQEQPGSESRATGGGGM